jgi:methylmalonyl-CoA/ethylmalonyl-CoA epimerase
MQPVKAINHIGIAVNCIDEQRPFYERTLGAAYEGEQIVADQKVKVGFFKIGPAGAEVRIELLEPTDPSSTVAQFIDKRGQGLHHVAYTVDDLPSRIAELQEQGVRMIDTAPRDGAHAMRIAFVHPKSSGGVLTELCQPTH